MVKYSQKTFHKGSYMDTERFKKCEHCHGWVDLLVQEFAFEREKVYHLECFEEKLKQEDPP